MSTFTTINQGGGLLLIYLRKDVEREWGVEKGDEVKMNVVDGKLIVEKVD